LPPIEAHSQVILSKNDEGYSTNSFLEQNLAQSAPIHGKAHKDQTVPEINEIKTWTTIAKYNFYIDKQEKKLSKMRIEQTR
jgi:hypothetical protein